MDSKENKRGQEEKLLKEILYPKDRKYKGTDEMNLPINSKRVIGILGILIVLVCLNFFIIAEEFAQKEQINYNQELQETVDKLIKDLESKDVYVRENAAITLGRIENPKSTIPLIKTLKEDKNWKVRWRAAGALGKIGDKKAVPYLEDILKTEKSFWVQQEIIKSIKKLTGAAPTLSEDLKEKIAWNDLDNLLIGLELYFQDYGCYPNGKGTKAAVGFNALITNIDKRDNWKGPYMKFRNSNNNIPVDPWGNMYEYEAPISNVQSYTIWCKGAKGNYKSYYITPGLFKRLSKDCPFTF